MNPTKLFFLKQYLNSADRSILAEIQEDDTADCGFGITICQILVQMFNPEGKGLEVDSTLGVGSMFSFLLQDKKEEGDLMQSEGLESGKVSIDREEYSQYEEQDLDDSFTAIPSMAMSIQQRFQIAHEQPYQFMHGLDHSPMR